jgi:predicted HicB family RNase H-like nuclease
MADVEQFKNLFGETEDLETLFPLIRKRAPRFTYTVVYRLSEKLKERLDAACDRHNIELCALARVVLTQRAKRLVQIPYSKEGHPWVMTKIERLAERKRGTSYKKVAVRLSMAAIKDLNRAAKTHQTTSVNLVSRTFEHSAEALLAMPKS